MDTDVQALQILFALIKIVDKVSDIRHELKHTDLGTGDLVEIERRALAALDALTGEY